MQLRAIAGAALAAAFLTAPLAAQSGYLSNDWLGYGGGTLTTYSSLSDALSHSGSTGMFAFPDQDFSAFFIQHNAAAAGAGYPPSEAIVGTNWFSSVDGNEDGAGNPYNNNVGFMQIYDADASTVGSITLGWTDPLLTHFELDASGGPTVTGCDVAYDINAADDCGRLWDGGTSANGGSFLTWNLSLSETYATSATFNSATGVYESNGKPLTAAGLFSGTFYDASADAWYDFSVPIDNTSTFSETADPADVPTAGGLYVTPEPATMSLMAFGLIGLAGMKRRKRNR
jgi:hypothetical protein